MKKLMVIASCAVLLMAAGCKDKNTPEAESLVGSVATPSWQAPESYDMTSSMTAIVKIDFTQSFSAEQLAAVKDKMTDGQIVHEGDLLAAFSGENCLGVDTIHADQAGLFFLYMTGSSEENPANVQLRYYSTQLSNIFAANESFAFSNDGHLGSVSEPYTPAWSIAK